MTGGVRKVDDRTPPVCEGSIKTSEGFFVEFKVNRGLSDTSPCQLY